MFNLIIMHDNNYMVFLGLEYNVLKTYMKSFLNENLPFDWK